MSTERYSSLSQTLTLPSGLAIARSRLFYSFLMKLRDLILSVFLHQKGIKLAKGLLFSVTSTLHSCHTSTLPACSVFFSVFPFFSFILFFHFFFLLKIRWREVQPVLINSAVKSAFVFLVNFKDVDGIVFHQ